MNKHITPGQAAYNRACELGDIRLIDHWYALEPKAQRNFESIAAAAIHAHFASIGARGGGKGTPAQARAARKNGLANRKSKGKPRPG